MAPAITDVDYVICVDGKARLGKLNGTPQLASAQTFDANQPANDLAAEIKKRLNAAGGVKWRS